MFFSLDLIESELRQFITPQAEVMDQDPEALRRAFDGLGERSLLGLRLPEAWGGGAMSDHTFCHFQELIARYSGALAFLQTQHQSAGMFLLRSENEALKQKYLPKLGRGEVTIGVGFSHLRRRGEPSMKALPVDGGYQLDGIVPWVSGFGCFQAVVIAAVLPSDRAVYGLVPFVKTQQPTGGQISFSDPMPLAAMSSTNTVTAELSQWFLPESHLLDIKPTDAIQKSDVLNVLQHSFFALGCAKAGLDIVTAAGQGKALAWIQNAYELLNQELHQCRAAIFAADGQPFEQRLELRAWAIELAVQCAHAAVTVSAGAANHLHHPAQRVYREALVYTVAGQTTAVMKATLARLLRRRNK